MGGSSEYRAASYPPEKASKLPKGAMQLYGMYIVPRVMRYGNPIEAQVSTIQLRTWSLSAIGLAAKTCQLRDAGD